MQYSWRRWFAPSPGTPWTGTAVLQASPLGRALTGLAVAAFLVHITVLATPSLATIRFSWSNLAQLTLGALAVLAMLEAGWHSGRFGRQTWFLAALAVGAYTVGQGIITYRWTTLYHWYSPHAKDQFFFFWVIVETSNVDLADGHSNAHLKIPPGSYVLVTVSDTGVGMDAQTLPRIFDPFFTTKPQGKGTGLGLATVYGIVRQSGGYIWVHSAPGMGAIFRIYLPRVAGHVEPLAPRPRLVTPKGGNQTILLVDDDLQLRRFAERVLTKAGFTVLEAEGGEEAQIVASSHRGPIHLLLTDVVLPGSSGREIAQRICGNRGETQLLYMSGYAGDTIVQRGVLETGICFLQKPFTPDLLLEKVKEMLHASPVGDKSIFGEMKEY